MAEYLAVVVIASIALYYQLFVTGAVGNELIAYFDLSFAYFVWIFIIGAAFGAIASVLAGVLDRWGRASAMGFWTLGPVIGALVTTQISTRTLDAHPDWQFHYRLCGVISLVIAVVAVIGLRELSPQLRDQIMVTLRDRALIEARARGLDVKELAQGVWRQMLRPNIIGSALAISLFLAFFYTIVSFLPVYMATNFGFSPARANALGNWYWTANAVALVRRGSAAGAGRFAGTVGALVVDLPGRADRLPAVRLPDGRALEPEEGGRGRQGARRTRRARTRRDRA